MSILISDYYYDDPIQRKNGEFDIVTWDMKGYIFYEAKFRKEPITLKLIEDEIMQVKSAGLHCYKYGFLSKSGFDVEPDEHLIFITLDEIYSGL